MKRKLFAIIFCIIALGQYVEDHQLDAQSTASYGTVVTSLNTTSTGAVTGTAFAVPSSYAAIITWQVVADGSALSVNLEGSNDNSTYFTIDSQTTATGGNKTFGFTAVKFVRCSQVSRTGGTNTTCTIVTNRGFINSGGFSLNRVLTNDGTAAAPAYSFLSDGTKGLFSSGTNALGIALAGTELMRASTSGFTIFSDTIGYRVGSGADTTLLRGGAASRWVFGGTGTTMLQLGGTTSSFSALKQNGGQILVRLADDSADGDIIAGGVGGKAAIRLGTSNVLLVSATAPSAPSACGTSPVVTSSNGTATFNITGGTGGTATGCTITMPAATTGWNCQVDNRTAIAAHRADRTTRQTASTTTSVTWEYQIVSTGAATAFTASDVFAGICFPY